MAALAAVAAHQTRFQPLDPADPLYPCSVMESRYLTACYTIQTSAMLQLNKGDVAQAARGCDRAPGALRVTCYQSLGRDVSAYARRDPDEAIRLCSLGSADYRGWCYYGVVKSLVDWDTTTDLGFAFCRHVSDKNPYVAPPLKRTDCSLVSDGAVALVMTDETTARSMEKAVRFRAAVQVNDFLPISKRDITRFEGAAEALRRALDAAGVGLNELSFVESHDCFTIAELLEYEAMGLTEPGQGARRAGRLDG